MPEQRPKPGDRVRVTFTGEYRGEMMGVVKLDTGTDTALFLRQSLGLVIEVIEPEYVDGAMYQDAMDDFYLFDANSDGSPQWFVPGAETCYAFTFPSRPLRKLVPEP